MSNNTFTKENTADAEYYAVIGSSDAVPCFYKGISAPGYSVLYADHDDWVGCGGSPYFEHIELSRPIGERKEDFLIPISYVKKFTPLVVGDVIVREETRGLREFTLGSQTVAERYNENDPHDDEFWVLSFADRPNTGKQPVGDDVVVDNDYKNTNWAGSFVWHNDCLCPISLWKPNHSAMLKQYQAEQTAIKEKLSSEACELLSKQFDDEWRRAQSNGLSGNGQAQAEQALQKPALVDENSDSCKIGNIGNILHNMSCSMSDDEQSEFGEYASYCWELSKQLNQPTIGAVERPVFTQAMKDAGQPPLVGSVVEMFDSPSNSYVKCEIICHSKKALFIEVEGWDSAIAVADDSLFRPIDNRTDEEKLRDTLADIMMENNLVTPFNAPYLLTQMLASDKFTITLNK